MGRCQSAASGSAPLSINQAGVQDIKRNIESRFETHRNTSTKKVFGKQNIKITQGKGFDYNSPLLFSSTYKRFGPIVLEGPCNNYGCAYDVQQMSDVEISSFNKTIVGESENIWNDIKTKLQQDASTQFEGNQGKLDAINSGINSAEDEVLKEIETIIENMTDTELGKDQTVEIEYITPIKCSDPCGEAKGPALTQNAQIVVKSEDIINKTIEIVQKRLAEHDIDVTQETSSTNDQCIMEMVSSTCCCIICMIIFYMMYKTLMDSGGGETGAAIGKAAAMKLAKKAAK